MDPCAAGMLLRRTRCAEPRKEGVESAHAQTLIDWATATADAGDRSLLQGLRDWVKHKIDAVARAITSA